MTHQLPLTEPRPIWQLTPTEERELPHRVLELLKQHRGAARAIKGDDMAALLGYVNDRGEPQDRQIRQVIEHLLDDGVLIASSVHEPYGYFLVEALEEIEPYRATLKSRAVKNLKRLANFDRGVRAKFGGQYALPLQYVDSAIEELEQ